ncbi:hypothetical protein C8J57DRAFT_1731837 [Mycena rebaudengoi]|nr:hypothetical protein C8J57DRAFT_1731837 [Mycena rebaudengoi]
MLAVAAPVLRYPSGTRHQQSSTALQSMNTLQTRLFLFLWSTRIDERCASRQRARTRALEEHQRVNAHLRAHPSHPGPTRFEPSPTNIPTALRVVRADVGGVDLKLRATSCARLLLPAGIAGVGLTTWVRSPTRSAPLSFLSCRTASSQLRSTRTSLRPPASCYSLRLRVRFRPTDIAPRGSHLAHRRARRALLLPVAVLACLACLSLLRDGIADAGRRYHGYGTGDSDGSIPAPGSACFRPQTRRLLLKAALACLTRLSYAARRYRAWARRGHDHT